MPSQSRSLCMWVVFSLVWLRVVLCLTVDTHNTPTNLQQQQQQQQEHHARTARQLHRILDPFGLLGKAGEAVSGAVEGVGKTLDRGAKHMGQMMQQGAETLDSAFKDHVGHVQAGLEEAGKVASIVGEDLVDSVSSLVNNHIQQQQQQQQQQQSEDEMFRTRQEHGGITRTQEQKNTRPQESNRVEQREGMIDSLLRMVGIDTSQVGIMALNVLIFLAELITSSLIGEDLNEVPESRQGADETSVLSWFLSRSPNKVEAMLREAQDPGLPRAIIEKLERATGDSTSCVQLLVCKLSPVVWGLQRTVKESTQARAIHSDAPQPGIMQTLYSALPPLNDFVTFSEACETQFPQCPLIHLAELFADK